MNRARANSTPITWLSSKRNMKIALALVCGFAIIHTAGTKRESADTGVQGGEGGRYLELAQELLANKVVDFLSREAYHFESRRESEGLTVPKFN